MDQLLLKLHKIRFDKNKIKMFNNTFLYRMIHLFKNKVCRTNLKHNMMTYYRAYFKQQRNHIFTLEERENDK